MVTTSLGLFTFGFGLVARLGYFKHMFITKGIPGVYPRNTVYALMPLGVFFLSLSISLWVEENVFTVVFFGSMILVLVCLFWQPRWLKPAWLRWAGSGSVPESTLAQASVAETQKSQLNLEGAGIPVSALSAFQGFSGSNPLPPAPLVCYTHPRPDRHLPAPGRHRRHHPGPHPLRCPSAGSECGPLNLPPNPNAPLGLIPGCTELRDRV